MNMLLSVPRNETDCPECSMTLIFQLLMRNSLDVSQHSHHTKSVCVTLKEEVLMLQTMIYSQSYHQEVMSRKYKLASVLTFKGKFKYTEGSKKLI